MAGWQCQFPNVDYAKPTRLYSDVPGIGAFGKCGWPQLDGNHNSRGPLPRTCGHNHKAKTIGRDKSGQGFNVSPTAAYPEAMCEWIARLIFNDWITWSAKPLREGNAQSHQASASSLAKDVEITEVFCGRGRWSWRSRAVHTCGGRRRFGG